VTVQPEPRPVSNVELPLDWSSVTDLPVLAANQLMIQVDVVGGQPDSIVLVIGHASPPPMFGTPEELAATLAEAAPIPVRPIARVSMSRRRLVEWIAVLSTAAAKLENDFGPAGT
jgi:hypothetical protein